MEDWQKTFLAVLETTAVEIEHFFQDVTEVIEDVAEEIGETIDNINEQLQDTVFVEIDRYFNELFTPIIDFEFHLDSEDIFFDAMAEDMDFLRNPKVNPTLAHHPACIGCHHYHGQVYGETLLVCGMHPYGWDGNKCPDWEKYQQRTN
jgi:hypothetical protein